MTLAVPAHSLDIDAVVRGLETDPVQGLAADVAAARLAHDGRNELVEEPPVPAWRRLAAQFNQLVVWILLGAAVIAGVTGEWIDAGAILAIVLMNAFLGFVQEGRAERALVALQKISAPQARVVRGGKDAVVDGGELVQGDVVVLEAGDRVPADARLIEAFGLRLDEALLTGESVPVDKVAGAALEASAPLATRTNVVHAGSMVVAGSGRAVVVATGMSSELGRIAGLMQRQEREPTPLQKKLAELGRALLVVCLVVAALVFALEWWREGHLGEALLLSISLAVAAVPEGLPAVVTVALAVGLQRMARRNALIRRLPSVETLGAVTVICSDKTGTLTRNEMTVRELWVGGRRLQVTGAGYAPTGEVLTTDGSPARVDAGTDVALRSALLVAAQCNNARLEPTEEGHDWRVVGDPTEGALLVVARKAGVEATEPVRSQIPFDSDRKMMSVIVDRGGQQAMLTKGAPEVVLPHCVATRGPDGQTVPLDDAGRSAALAEAEAMAGRALRVLALAERAAPESDGAGGWREDGLVLAGLVGMIDPPREEAKVAVVRCREAGIRPVMITGDHPATALAIGRELGIAGSEDRAVTGAELDELDDVALAAQVERMPVYARVTAEHKLRIVGAWRRRGEVVAMTGDGVNDAPAVRAADIGIAMGRGGTEVTKQASAMVLVDDNFASIVAAVEEGRAIYDNIRRVVLLLLGCNFGEVLLIVVAALVGWPVPLVAVQLLWMNLVTDGLPALGLVMESPEAGIMRRPPRPPNEPVLTRTSVALILVLGTLVAGVTAVAFALTYAGDPAQLDRARTVAFCVMAYGQLFMAFAARSQWATLPQLGLFTNPHLLGAILVSGLLQLGTVAVPGAHRVFSTTGHPGTEWLFVFGLALIPVTVVEVAKLVLALIRKRTGTAKGTGTATNASTVEVRP